MLRISISIPFGQLKHGKIVPMTGELQWMAIIFLEGIGKEEWAVVWLSMLERVLMLSSGLEMLKLNLNG